jgi:hypothetical protein
VVFVVVAVRAPKAPLHAFFDRSLLPLLLLHQGISRPLLGLAFLGRSLLARLLLLERRTLLGGRTLFSTRTLRAGCLLGARDNRTTHQNKGRRREHDHVLFHPDLLSGNSS